MELFNLPVLLCAAASTLAFVTMSQITGSSSDSPVVDEKIQSRSQSQSQSRPQLRSNKSEKKRNFSGGGFSSNGTIQYGGFQELTDANLHEYLNSGNVLFINLHAEDWCGHCQNLKPIWDNFSGECANLQTIKVLKCDAEKETDCSTFFKVQGYPTIVLYKDGKSTVYEGEKNPKAFCAFLKKHCQ